MAVRLLSSTVILADTIQVKNAQFIQMLTVQGSSRKTVLELKQGRGQWGTSGARPTLFAIGAQRIMSFVLVRRCRLSTIFM